MRLMIFPCLSLVVLLTSCIQSGSKQKTTGNETDTLTKEIIAEMPLNMVNPPITSGTIDRYSSALESILPAKNNLEIIAEGFIWSEGPVWLPDQNKLIFSDIPRNSIFQWSAENGLSLYLDSAGYNGPVTGGNDLVGSNGLLLDPDGRLILCQHGNRQIQEWMPLLTVLNINSLQ